MTTWPGYKPGDQKQRRGVNVWCLLSGSLSRVQWFNRQRHVRPGVRCLLQSVQSGERQPRLVPRTACESSLVSGSLKWISSGGKQWRESCLSTRALHYLHSLKTKGTRFPKRAGRLAWYLEAVLTLVGGEKHHMQRCGKTPVIRVEKMKPHQINHHTSAHTRDL